MTRLATMNPAAIKAIFSPESTDTLITLLTFYDPDDQNRVIGKIADGYTQRLPDEDEEDEEDEEIVYGVVSRGENYGFLPVQITLPTEEEAQAPRASLAINDVTRILTPKIRTLTGPVRVKMELVLSSTPNEVEVSFDYFYISSISYTRDTVNCSLSMINLDREPFPVHSFTPSYFPGLY